MGMEVDEEDSNRSGGRERISSAVEKKGAVGGMKEQGNKCGNII